MRSPPRPTDPLFRKSLSHISRVENRPIRFTKRRGDIFSSSSVPVPNGHICSQSRIFELTRRSPKCSLRWQPLHFGKLYAVIPSYDLLDRQIERNRNIYQVALTNMSGFRTFWRGAKVPICYGLNCVGQVRRFAGFQEIRWVRVLLAYNSESFVVRRSEEGSAIALFVIFWRFCWGNR